MRLAAWLVVSFVLVLCTGASTIPTAVRDNRCIGVEDENVCPLYKVTIVQLLARPLFYIGQRIEVRGFVHREFEDSGLHPSRKAYDDRHINYALTKSALWFSPSRGAKGMETCQDKYVVVRGIFDVANTGHRGAWGGAVTEVTVCEPVEEVRGAT